ncbi:hypothetical protein ACLK10_21140 [Escherichia coli]
MPAGERFGEFHGENSYTTKKKTTPAAPAAVLLNLSPVNQRTVIATL